MLKLSLLVVVSLAFVLTSPLTSSHQDRAGVQCVPELTTRMIAEQTSLPEYPEEAEPGSVSGSGFCRGSFRY
jgi:hypothetical protein